ncbi:MAG: shikimate dehydrogenase [Gallionella sp.]|nr:shikimate dehydrogenase [Gallionella sp.]
MTDKYAVIGNPIAHSKSPLIHKMFAEQTGQDISYEAVLAPPDGFIATVKRLRKEGYKGCNVTVPFKQEATDLASYLTPEVLEANSANTLTFKDGAIVANNTDGAGLVRDIECNFGIPLQGKRVLLMGAGGAARGVLIPLVFAKVQRMAIANRTLERAQEMLVHGQRFYEDRPGMEIAAKVYSELGDERFDVIINATSTGLTDEMLPLPDTIFAPGALAYDMMYGRETPFMKFAREQGVAKVSDGLGMLVEQAAEAFYIWRGVRPDTAPVIAALRKQ